ncbi:MAG: SIR2 family protein [Syntrophales bacterium]
MTSFDFSVSETVLLTGAGFTHNFGGFLAVDMWDEIHNHFQRYNRSTENSRLLKEIKKNFNYEELYQTVERSSDFNPQEKEAFMNAVLSAYDTLDKIVCSYKSRIPNITAEVDTSKLRNFFQLLNGQGRNFGFFFTLNQDILIERYFSEGPTGPVLPGIKANYARFNIGRYKSLDSTDYPTVMKDRELEKAKMTMKSLGHLYYIKLHGSYDWRDEQNRARMIIGMHKADQIGADDILSWYFRLFEEVLSLNKRRLLIIGYGFGDPHINKVIINAIKNHHLKIYVISPEARVSFREKVNRIDSDLWKSTAGYYPYSLKKLFPMGGNSPHYENFKKDFFC